MTSKLADKFNADNPSFIPIGKLTSFKPVDKIHTKQHKKPYKYRSKNGELWSPPKGWIPSYRCQACREIMGRKEPTTCPQKITVCGHITCAKCIVTSYLVDLNNMCPVKGCGKCVDPKQKDHVLLWQS